MTAPVLVTSADSNFAMPCAVMLRSVADNLTWTPYARAVVMDVGLTPSDRHKIRKSLRGTPLAVEFLALDPNLLDGLKVDLHVSKATYARLFAVDILQARFDRLIYLDSDFVVLRDIGELWEMPLQGHPIAAVQDALAGLAGATMGMLHNDFWEIPDECPCFNAGLMVIDVNCWIAERAGQKALALIRDNPDKIRWWDQDALNITFAGNFLQIDPVWNVQPHAFMRPTADHAVWSLEIISRCKAAPRAIHFAGAVKPWQDNGLAWGAEHFMRYLYRTAWRDLIPNAPWRTPRISLGRQVRRTIKRIQVQWKERRGSSRTGCG